MRQSVHLTPEQTAFADRHFGVGCDQLLLVEPPASPVDFRYRIFNADGGEVEQCGNGACCFVRFVHDQAHRQVRGFGWKPRPGSSAPAWKRTVW